MMSRLPSLAFLTLLALASTAEAQTTTPTVSAALLSITHADGTFTYQKVNDQWYVNRRDCGLDVYDPLTDMPTNVELRVDPTRVTAAPFGNFPRVFIGMNCNLGANRSGSTTAPCVEAKGHTSNSPITKLANVYTITLESIRPITTAANADNYDLCNPSRNSALDVFILPDTTGSEDTATFVQLRIFGDMSLPVAPTVTTTNPQGDNSVNIEWSTGGSFEILGQLHYFAVTGCGTSAGDGGVSDGGVDAAIDDAAVADAGTGTDGGVLVVGTTLTEGALPPLLAADVYQGSEGLSGTAAIRTSDLGLTGAGQTASLGMVMRDAAGNYSVVSNLVCVQRVTTYGLCEASGGDCPQGGCAIARDDEAPFSVGGFGIALVTLAWLVIRRGGRS